MLDSVDRRQAVRGKIRDAARAQGRATKCNELLFTANVFVGIVRRATGKDENWKLDMNNTFG